MKNLSILLVALLGCSACGDPQEEHVWQDQTDQIDKAAEVENLLMEKSRQQREQAAGDPGRRAE